MKKYHVTIPITGVYTVEVEVPDDADSDAIFDAAVDLHSKNSEDGDVTWEFTSEVTTGNVCHAMQNTWEYEEIQ